MGKPESVYVYFQRCKHERPFLCAERKRRAYKRRLNASSLFALICERRTAQKAYADLLITDVIGKAVVYNRITDLP